MSAVVSLPRPPEVEAVSDAYLFATRLFTPGTRGHAACMLNRLGEREWTLERTAVGIRQDTIAEFCAAAQRAAAEGDHDEADAITGELATLGVGLATSANTMGAA